METLLTTNNATYVTRDVNVIAPFGGCVTSVHRYNHSKHLSGEKGPPVVVAGCLVDHFAAKNMPDVCTFGSFCQMDQRT